MRGHPARPIFGDAHLFEFTKKNWLLALLDDPDQERVRAELTTFFGPRAEAYLNVYEQMRDRVPRTAFVMTWGWPVFLGAFIWPFYRKMYTMGAVMILVPIVLGLVLSGAGPAVIVVAFAMTAKTFYVQTGLSRISKADALALTGEERRDYLSRAGGVSLTAGVLAAILFAALFGLTLVGIFADPKAAA
jgi:hypothetical protein